MARTPWCAIWQTSCSPAPVGLPRRRHRGARTIPGCGVERLAAPLRRLRPFAGGPAGALCTLGNGYFASRGAACEAAADGTHYPGTYLAGGYDRQCSEVADRRVENEDLVNLPNWLALQWRVSGGQWFDPGGMALLEYTQTLDLREGVLERVVRLRDEAGRRTQLRERRLVHMASPHLAALSLALTPENWSGTVEVRSAIDGTVRNDGVARYRGLESGHLEPVEASAEPARRLFLKMRTRQSRLEVALAARTRLYPRRRGRDARADRPRGAGPGVAAFGIRLDEGRTVEVEKVVALYTSRDRRSPNAGWPRGRPSATAANFAPLQASHARAWAQLWPARLPPAADDVAAHDGPGRRRAGPRLARRGLPRPHLLGRAVHLPAAQPAPAGDHPLAADVPLPAPRRGARQRRRARPASPARCTRGRAAATGARRARSCT
jgi:hypothetical protein